MHLKSIGTLQVSQLWVSSRQFVRVYCSYCELLTELCAISACKDLLCIIMTILTNFNWSANIRILQFTFSIVFTTRIIRKIISQSIKRWIFRLPNTQSTRCLGNHSVLLVRIKILWTLQVYKLKIGTQTVAAHSNDYCVIHFNYWQHSKIAAEQKKHDFYMNSFSVLTCRPSVVFFTVVGDVTLTAWERYLWSLISWFAARYRHIFAGAVRIVKVRQGITDQYSTISFILIWFSN